MVSILVIILYTLQHRADGPFGILARTIILYGYTAINHHETLFPHPRPAWRYPRPQYRQHGRHDTAS